MSADASKARARGTSIRHLQAEHCGDWLKIVRVQVTGSDVIHSFAVPSFGIKIDAVPGRLNETWFKATKEGIYYGQCSELCGKNHAFMPIAVRVVSEGDFNGWLEEAKKKYARGDDSAPRAFAARESRKTE